MDDDSKTRKKRLREWEKGQVFPAAEGEIVSKKLVHTLYTIILPYRKSGW